MIFLLKWLIAESGTHEIPSRWCIWKMVNTEMYWQSLCWLSLSCRSHITHGWVTHSYVFHIYWDSHYSLRKRGKGEEEGNWRRKRGCSRTGRVIKYTKIGMSSKWKRRCVLLDRIFTTDWIQGCARVIRTSVGRYYHQVPSWPPRCINTECRNAECIKTSTIIK